MITLVAISYTSKDEHTSNFRQESKNLPTVSAYPATGYSQVSQQDSHPNLGELCTKPLISSTRVSASVISLICLLLGSLTIIPNLSIAWHLEFAGQIIVIGFLLSFMNFYSCRIFFPTPISSSRPDSDNRGYNILIRLSLGNYSHPT